MCLAWSCAAYGFEDLDVLTSDRGLYACMHGCMDECMSVYMHGMVWYGMVCMVCMACMYVWYVWSASMYVCMYVRMYVCMSVCMYVFMCQCMSMYVNACECMYTCTHGCMLWYVVIVYVVLCYVHTHL